MSQGCQPDRQMTTADALRILGVSGDADADALRTAFRTAAKRAHPDQNGGDGEQVRLIIEAYRLLRPTGPRHRTPRRLVIDPGEAMLGGWRPFALADGRTLSVRLPPGLRDGEVLSVEGQPVTVSIVGADGQGVLGDHLCITAEIPASVAVLGGRLVVKTPDGPQSIWVSADEGGRGLAHVHGLGLPARGRYAQGDLYVRLTTIAAPVAESPAEAKLRRFSAEWAA
jgi:curved DNA-binding protein